ncbi:MAG: hypothetical protein H7Y20_11565 [Bryobacteraceae bacterium]|nr:hypothetical protein [Bryobacteraceae bacterium]
MPEGAARDERLGGIILNGRALTLATAFACLTVNASEGPVTREGAYWVQTQRGKLASPPGSVLKVIMRGPVTVRGGARASEYVLRTRVRARSEAEARRLFSQLHLKTSTQKEVSTLTLSYPARPLGSAELEVLTTSSASAWVETYNGDVQICDLDMNVYVKTGAGSIQLDRIGGEVVARTAGGEVRMGSIGGSVRCFSGGGTIEVEKTGGESWFETAGGNIHLAEAAGAVHASTAGGNIRIGRARGSVVASSAGGRIEVREAGGAVMAGNSGGSIQVGPAQGVRLEATGGSIRLRGSSGALRAVSDVGSILAELIPGVRLQDSTLSTGAGDITVFIPSNTALTIKALNDSNQLGRIISDFPEILVRQLQEESRMRAEGTLNGGGPLLQLTSTGGTIYLRRLPR